MGSDMYRQQILDHYRNPQNYRELENPIFTHGGENTSCSDEIRVYVSLDKNDRIKTVSFTGEGCAISQAAASMLSGELAS
jgi:nitrogen fixation NifU-like protein